MVRARAPIAVLTLVVSALLAPVLIGNVHAMGCNPPGCQFTANTNVPASDGNIWVEVDNNTGSWCGASAICRLPQTFTFLNNSIHTIRVLNGTFIAASSGARYVWKQWSIFGTAWTTSTMMRTQPIYNNYTGAASFTAQFDKQFQLSLTFTDQSGQTINPPANVTLASGSSTITNSSYSNWWVSSKVWSVTDATWEGIRGSVANGQTIDMTSGPVTKTISLLAYPASIQIVDNNNNPVSGASVTISFANSTSTTLTSDSKGTVNLGHIPGGIFTVRVFYQNQNQGPFSLTAVNKPTNTIQLNIGSSTASTTTSAIVLLTIFGIAFFLILLAIKVRRPPPPPTI